MFVFRMSRLLAVSAVVGTGSFIVITGPASVASAQSSAKPPAVCATLKGSGTADTAKLKVCTKATTGGTGSIADFVPTGGTVTWRNGKTTTYTSTSTTGTLCPSGDGDFLVTGATTGGTNKAIPTGSPVSMEVCVDPTTFALSNAPGTKVKF